MSVQVGTVKAPVIAFGSGSANFANDPTKDVTLALQTGVRHLDNAEAYQNEVYVGEVIKRSGIPRDQLIITSKFGKFQREVTEARKPLLQSLKHLQTDYVDCYLIHDPSAPAKGGTSIQKVWAELQELKRGVCRPLGVRQLTMSREGLVKEVGVSNFRPSHIDELLATAKEAPVINQIELHPYLWTHTKYTVDHCKANGIKIAAYGAQGPLKFPDQPVYPVIERIGKERGISPGQVLQKWAQKAGADVIISVSTKVERIKQMLEVPHLDPLTDAEFNEVAEAGKKFFFRGFMPHLKEDWE